MRIIQAGLQSTVTITLPIPQDLPLSFASPQPLVVTRSTRQLLWLCLAIALVARVIGIFIIPLADSSEARYGEIARKMVETGDWITPQFDYGVPFWAKPPLSTWLSAIGIKLFGVNEFAVRLPSLLLCALVLTLVWQWIARRHSRDQALLTTVVLANMALFAAAAGAVMTDPALVFCVTLSMVAFWNAIHGGGRRWGYLLFVALGLGLLAKGPLAIVLTAMPVGVWVLLRGEWRGLWRNIPWLSGTLLALAIALPWYVIAEWKTPGFLHYFIVGEHIERFLHPGWSGDKYGNAHPQRIGAIWVYWIYAAFPFSLMALAWLVRFRRQTLQSIAQWRDGDGWVPYLLLWSVMPLLFFSIAGNIIWSYPLSALPAFACLAVEMHRRWHIAPQTPTCGIIAACCVVPLAGVVLVALYAGGSKAVKASQRELVREWLGQRPESSSELVYFLKKYQSALFYSAARARTTKSGTDLEALLANDSVDFIAVKPRDLGALPPLVRERFSIQREFNDILLLREKPPRAVTGSLP